MGPNERNQEKAHKEFLAQMILLLYRTNGVYAHLICEFNHYDMCLSGLVERDGEKWFCWIRDQYKNVHYIIRKVAWTPECDEYLDDHRASYIHWFHEGKPRYEYDGRPLKWFTDKWEHRNQIEEQAK